MTQWPYVQYLACSTEVLKCLKFPPLINLTMSGIDDFFFFFATVTEGVVHIVYKLVTGSSFGVTWQYKVSGGIGS